MSLNEDVCGLQTVVLTIYALVGEAQRLLGYLVDEDFFNGNRSEWVTIKAVLQSQRQFGHNELNST